METEILLPCSQNYVSSLQFHADFFDIHFFMF
jgi:hypothetical protein